jgi:ATP-binding cassette subfamily C exporter for protease/lipase
MTSDFFNRSILTRQLWIFRKEFLWVGIFSMIANVLMLTPSIYMLQVYDRVMKSQNELTLLMVTLFMILFFGIMAFSEWIRSRLLVRVGVRLDESFNSLVFNSSFDAWLNNAQERGQNAFVDLYNVRQFLTANGIIAFFDTPWTPVYITVIFLLNPFLGWLSVFFAFIQLAIAVLSHYLSTREIEVSTEAGNDSSRYVQSKLRNIEPIYAMGMLGNIREHWSSLHEQSLATMDNSLERQHRLQAFTKFVRYTMQSLTLGAGGLMVIQGKMSAGSMIAANLLMSRALQPLDLVVATWRPFVQAKAAFFRLEKLLEEYSGRYGAESLPIPTGAVKLEDLTASVSGRQEPVLHSINAEIAAGNVVVIIGPSGAGKSTLARCILGIWPKREGKVLLDGTPVEKWRREELGPHIGYLPQDIELFDGTIAENIARFSELDSEKVIEAARKSGIHDMVLRFPNGYDTPIGDAGSILSGGQRQRLGLARAIYGNPAVVVLDEPNANLDDVGERSLKQAVNELRQAGKTVILITHRPGLISVADQLMVMQQGRLMMSGPRDQVIAKLTPQRSKPAVAIA